MSCWEVLGLDAQSDARAIKRRYAELIKIFRPDADPVGFQRVREAYDHALFMARLDESDAPVQADTPPASPSPSTDAQWLHALMATLTLDELDNALHTARTHGGQALFERALLAHCVSPARARHVDRRLAGLGLDAVVQHAALIIFTFSSWQGAASA